jgi:hypothetical protein
MSEEYSTEELENQTVELYHEMFRMVMDKCQTHAPIAVAGTMVGLAMRLYRTTLDDQAYANMMEYIATNTDLIEPFSLMEFESPTVH